MNINVEINEDKKLVYREIKRFIDEIKNEIKFVLDELCFTRIDLEDERLKFIDKFSFIDRDKIFHHINFRGQETNFVSLIGSKTTKEFNTEDVLDYLNDYYIKWDAFWLVYPNIERHERKNIWIMEGYPYQQLKYLHNINKSELVYDNNKIIKIELDNSQENLITFKIFHTVDLGVF